MSVQTPVAILLAASLAIVASLILVNLVVCFSIQLLHLATILRSNKGWRVKAGPANSNLPFISVHVPTYNEPPDVVIGSLNALARLDYPNYEVLLVDNNTVDPAVYEPLRATCAGLGPRFKFFHFDKVQGAKAGALNLAIDLADRATKFVAIIDADYQAEPDFLSVAARCLSDPGTSFVQFPQAYRGVSNSSRAVEAELTDYFEAFAPSASNDRSVLLTGTLSVISLAALKEAGGWKGATVTEDAELGVRLFLNGHMGRYVPAIVGRGLLPLSLDSLKAQRNRWVAGNIQTLLLTSQELFSRRWNSATLSILAQLTAWPAFWLLPAVVIMTLAPFANQSEQLRIVLHLAAATILASGIGVALRLCINAVLRRDGFGRIPSALAVKLALVWTSSTSFFPALLRHQIPFVRTSKSASASTRRLAAAQLLLGAWALLAALAYVAAQENLLALACLLIGASVPAGWWVDASLQQYAIQTSLPTNNS